MSFPKVSRSLRTGANPSSISAWVTYSCWLRSAARSKGQILMALMP